MNARSNKNTRKSGSRSVSRSGSRSVSRSGSINGTRSNRSKKRTLEELIFELNGEEKKIAKLSAELKDETRYVGRFKKKVNSLEHPNLNILKEYDIKINDRKEVLKRLIKAEKKTSKLNKKIREKLELE